MKYFSLKFSNRQIEVFQTTLWTGKLHIERLTPEENIMTEKSVH